MTPPRMLAALAAAVVLGGAVTACDSSGGSAPAPSSSGSASQSAAVSPAASTPGSAATSVRPSVPVPAPTRSVTSARPTSPGPTATASPAAPRATSQVVVRPVNSAGAVVRGFVVRSSTATIDCSGGLRSPVSMSDDVLFCSPSAASATACWHAADRTRAYCLPDPRTRVLVEHRLQGGAFPAARPVEVPPAPASLDLLDGTRCSVRDGGAAARLTVHPDWVPYYFCGTGADRAVWGPQGSSNSGVTRGDGVWQVQLAASDGTGGLRALGVSRAWFVGTA